jgi:hypothetical protein
VSRLQSSTTPQFWKLFAHLPAEVQDLAVEKYELFKENPFNPSLGFQQKGKVWTVDIGRSYRAIALRQKDELTWFWIGSHEDYNGILSRLK